MTDENMNDDILNDEIRDLLPAWAVDAVDDDERARVDARLAIDPELQHEADQLKELTAALADDGDSPPPARLRASVLDEIARTPQEDAHENETGDAGDTAEVVSLADRAPSRRRAVMFLAAAAVIIIALIGPVMIGENEPTRNERIAAVLADGDSTRRSLEGDDIGTVEIAVSDDRRAAVLTGTDITVPTEDRTYELWHIDDTGTPTSLGIFAPTPQGELEALIELADTDDGGVDRIGDATLAISEEPAGGSPDDAPTGTILAISA